MIEQEIRRCLLDLVDCQTFKFLNFHILGALPFLASELLDFRAFGFSDFGLSRLGLLKPRDFLTQGLSDSVTLRISDFRILSLPDF